MYEDFYGFSERPFNLGPDSRFLYLTPSHAEAFSGMFSGVRERRGITVITGDPGIGKTTLIGALLSGLDEAVRTASIVLTHMEFRDLLKSILIELGIPAKGRDTFALLEEFYLYLATRPQDEIVAIIIDEAQGLETRALKSLMELWPGPNPRRRLLQTVLVGQPELEAKLDSKDLTEFRERIAVRRHIRPMNRKESNVYIDHRLRIVGSSGVFKPEAVDRICDYAGGIPRVINMVCDHSLLIGYVKSKRQIDAKIVTEAIKDLSLFEPKEAKGSRRVNCPSEPLQAEGPHPEAPVLEPVQEPRLRRRPVYQTLAGALSVVVALGLLILSTSDLVTRKETKVKDIGTVIAEKGSTSSVLAVQNQSLEPVPSAKVQRERPQHFVHNQRERPQHFAHNQRKGAQPDDLLVKQDIAWHMVQR